MRNIPLRFYILFHELLRYLTHCLPPYHGQYYIHSLRQQMCIFYVHICWYNRSIEYYISCIYYLLFCCLSYIYLLSVWHGAALVHSCHYCGRDASCMQPFRCPGEHWLASNSSLRTPNSSASLADLLHSPHKGIFFSLVLFRVNM